MAARHAAPGSARSSAGGGDGAPAGTSHRGAGRLRAYRRHADSLHLRGDPAPHDLSLCLLLPFGLLDSIGPTTPLIVAFIAYTFFALEALAAQLEEPFGTAPNDLALEAISLTIKATLRETLGERDLPAPPVAVDFVLR